MLDGKQSKKIINTTQEQCVWKWNSSNLFTQVQALSIGWSRILNWVPNHLKHLNSSMAFPIPRYYISLGLGPLGTLRLIGVIVLNHGYHHRTCGLSREWFRWSSLIPPASRPCLAHRYGPGRILHSRLIIIIIQKSFILLIHSLPDPLALCDYQAILLFPISIFFLTSL